LTAEEEGSRREWLFCLLAIEVGGVILHRKKKGGKKRRRKGIHSTLGALRGERKKGKEGGRETGATPLSLNLAGKGKGKGRKKGKGKRGEVNTRSQTFKTCQKKKDCQSPNPY